jgi:hypothetical protein
VSQIAQKLYENLQGACGSFLASHDTFWNLSHLLDTLENKSGYLHSDVTEDLVAMFCEQL